MKGESTDTPDKYSAGTRAACGMIAIVLGASAIMMLFNTDPKGEGWGLLATAGLFGKYAVTYRRSEEIRYAVSRLRLIAIMAVCTLPPFLLLLVFGGRSGWTQPLVLAFLVSLGAGPPVAPVCPCFGPAGAGSSTAGKAFQRHVRGCDIRSPFGTGK